MVTDSGRRVQIDLDDASLLERIRSGQRLALRGQWRSRPEAEGGAAAAGKGGQRVGRPDGCRGASRCFRAAAVDNPGEVRGRWRTGRDDTAESSGGADDGSERWSESPGRGGDETTDGSGAAEAGLQRERLHLL